MRPTSVRMDDNMRAWLEQRAKDCDTSVSAVVTQAVAAFRAMLAYEQGFERERPHEDNNGVDK